MRPPWRSTMPWTIERPSPDPSPTSLSVKNGSKIRRMACAVVPGRVRDEVYAHLIDLPREAGQPEGRINLLVDADVLEAMAQQIERVVDAARERRLARLLLVAARVVVQRLHDGLAARGAALHDAEHLPGVARR